MRTNNNQETYDGYDECDDCTILDELPNGWFKVDRCDGDIVHFNHDGVNIPQEEYQQARRDLIISKL